MQFLGVVVSDAFAGMSRVKRQQPVLATVNAPLPMGALHAIRMKGYTLGEWRIEQEMPAV